MQRRPFGKGIRSPGSPGSVRMSHSLRPEHDPYACLEKLDLKIRAFLADPVEKAAKIIVPITPEWGTGINK